MRLLLDSHTLIWAVDQHQRLGAQAHAAISDPANDLLRSTAINDLGATVLPITVEYATFSPGCPIITGIPSIGSSLPRRR